MLSLILLSSLAGISKSRSQRLFDSVPILINIVSREHLARISNSTIASIHGYKTRKGPRVNLILIRGSQPSVTQLTCRMPSTHTKIQSLSNRRLDNAT